MEFPVIDDVRWPIILRNPFNDMCAELNMLAYKYHGENAKMYRASDWV